MLTKFLPKKKFFWGKCLVYITNADKGGAIIIWETKDCINEANWQLNLTSNYKKRPHDPRLTHKRLSNNAIDRFKQERLIPIETAAALKIKHAEISKLHMIPKARKIVNPDELVVSCIGHHSTNIPKLVGYHLQRIVKNIPSYEQDSN